MFRPFEKLIKITLGGRDVEVPESNMLLRALQYLAPENIALGRFCWNEECQDCRVHYDMGPGTQNRTALSCKLMVQEGMRVTEAAREIRYCLRELRVDLAEKQPR